MLWKLLKIGATEQKSFIPHMIYSIIDGLVLGVFALNEYILIKSLKGSNYQIGFLFQFTVIVLIFSILINIFLKSIRKKKKLIRYVGIITRLPLFLFIFFPATMATADNFFFYQLVFLFIFLVYYMANPLLFPAINHLLKNSYSHQNFGRLYGYASTINKVMMLFTTFFFGLLLDYDKNSYRFVYPVIAVLGIVSIYILTMINYESNESTGFRKGFFSAVKESFRESIEILKTNRPYRDFENAFFFYGLAWMATAALIPIFFEQRLELNYSSIAFYKNSYNTISIIILPFFGKLISKIDPRKFAIYTFAFMFLHLFFMGFTEFMPFSFEFWGIRIYYSLIASYISYGIFGAMMALLWYIGSSYFCRNEEVSSYQSIHLSLTGLRGFMAPLLGVFLFELIGFAGVFLLSMASLAYAIYIMIASMKKYKLNEINPGLNQ